MKRKYNKTKTRRKNVKPRRKLETRAIKITWRRCSVCGNFWAYANKKPGVNYCASRCDQCRKVNSRFDRKPDPTPDQIAKRAAEIRENWDEKEHQRRYINTDGVKRVELKPVKIHIEEG